jgi:uncharacterized Zn finger protein
MKRKQKKIAWSCPRCSKGWMVDKDMILHCPQCGTMYGMNYAALKRSLRAQKKSK